MDCINPMFKSFGIRFSLVPAKDTERIIIAGDLAATSLLEFKEPLKVSLEKIFYPRKFEIMDFTLPHSTNSELLDLIGQFKSFKPSLLIFDVASQVPFKTVLRSRQSFWRRWLNMFDEPQNFSPEAGKRADVFKKHIQAIS